MKLSVTGQALSWFQEEWGFRLGDFVRVFVRYGGTGGFSIGLRKESPRDIGLSTTEGGITFFMTSEDIWYLENQDLVIDYNGVEDDIVYDIH